MAATKVRARKRRRTVGVPVEIVAEHIAADREYIVALIHAAHGVLDSEWATTEDTRKSAESFLRSHFSANLRMPGLLK